LIPEPGGPLLLEILPVDGGEGTTHTLTREDAQKLLAGAEATARERGLSWDREPLKLKPAPKLADLIKKSRELASRGEGSDDAGAG
jgi:CRISPR-associated protein Csb1